MWHNAQLRKGPQYGQLPIATTHDHTSLSDNNRRPLQTWLTQSTGLTRDQAREAIRESAPSVFAAFFAADAGAIATDYEVVEMDIFARDLLLDVDPSTRAVLQAMYDGEPLVPVKYSGGNQGRGNNVAKGVRTAVTWTSVKQAVEAGAARPMHDCAQAFLATQQIADLHWFGNDKAADGPVYKLPRVGNSSANRSRGDRRSAPYRGGGGGGRGDTNIDELIRIIQYGDDPAVLGDSGTGGAKFMSSLDDGGDGSDIDDVY